MSLHVMVLSRRKAQQHLSVSCNRDVPVFVIWILKAARPCINIQYHSSLCARLQISGNPNTTCHKCKQQWHIQSPSQKSSFHKRDHISLSYSFHSHSDQLKNWVEKQLMKFSKVKHQNLHLGRNNAVHQCTLELHWLESRKDTRWIMDPHGKTGQWHPGLE